MHNINFQPWIDFFHTYPHSGCVIAFLIVFIEALAIIGTIVPGSITMTALGFLIGSATIPAGSAFFCAFLGAVCGDYLSYLVGVYYKERIRKLGTIRRHPQLLERSEKFFRSHGGASIFLGRFLGVIRAMIPLVAGMLNMKQGRFLLAAIPSALLWVAVYLFPGILLGALSLELPPKAATTFTLTVLGLVVLVWILVWLLQHFFLRVCSLFDKYVNKLWQLMQKRVALRWFTEILSSSGRPADHTQLTLFIFAVVSGVLFFVIVASIVSHSYITEVNYPFFSLLQSLRLAWLDKIMVAITLLGDEKTMLVATALFFFWLVWKKYWYIAIHWCAVVALSAATVIEFKKIVLSPRPQGFTAQVFGSSFPSGHAALSIAIFGFLALLISRELPKEKKIIPFAVVAVIAVVIAFSRLYLGAHWLTDIFGSLFAGLTILLLVAISYRRRHVQHQIPLNSLITAIIGIFTAAWIGHGIIAFNSQLHGFTHVSQELNCSFKVWQQRSVPTIPLFRNNRLGHPVEAFNVEWVGDLNQIRQKLIGQGWQEQPIKLNLQGIIRVFSIDSVYHHFPLFPQLYSDKPPAMFLIKDTDEDNAILMLRLWRSNCSFTDSTFPLWIGTIEYHVASPKIFSLHKHKVFIGATDHLINFLSGFAWKQLIHLEEKQPPEIQALHWDGKLLLIWNKK